jgi:F420-0:gamma-glutamyl ligase
LATVTPLKKSIELAKHSEKNPRLVELTLPESKEVLRVRPSTIIVGLQIWFRLRQCGG